MTTMELIERGIGHNCLSDAYDLGREDAMNDDGVPRQLLEIGYAKGRADLIKQFDESAYLIIHVSEYGEYQPCCYNLRDIDEKLKEQSN